MAEEEKAQEEAAAPELQPEDSEQLKNLRILPPLQKEGTLERDELLDAVSLPPIRAEEPVSSLRGALGEVCGYAHLTSFRFVLDTTVSGDSKATSTDTVPVVSPYTGPNAVVSVPVAVKSLDENQPQSDKEQQVVLDDYDDLKPLLENGLSDGSGFRIVLERYDAATIRDQVTKVRYLLDGNAPYVTTLVDEAPEAQDREQDKKDSAKAPAAKAEEEKPERLSEIPIDRPVIMDSADLKDFFHLACGEEESLYEDTDKGGDKALVVPEHQPKHSKKKKHKGKKKEGENSDEDDANVKKPSGETIRATVRRLNELEETTRVKCLIQYSGFHPPPPSRRLMGDLCYLEVTTPGYPKEPVLNITGTPTGFYVNRTSIVDCKHMFDPSPAAKHCFSHELLDCLLQASDSFRSAWESALAASKERAALTTESTKDDPLFGLHRVAIRGDFGGFKNSSTASASQGIDSVVFRPSWLVPIPQEKQVNDNVWNHNSLHDYNPSRMETDLGNSFGLDVRSGSTRDWNEELQSAREMPVTSVQERIDRARLIHKVLTDFGEAAVVGAIAIFDGHVAPMNPNEPTRSHVYLHNNIFFSRAVDSGVETFKIATGDKSARKSASRDAQCMSALHRLDFDGLHTLATVLVDYLGTRFICQSIVPGILHGEKSHKLLCGAVEATSPLATDTEMLELLEKSIGKTYMIASRPVPTKPLTDERLAEIDELRTAAPFLLETDKIKNEEKDGVTDPVTMVCGPVEAKGIRGSDQRKYLLDLTRLSPRDANWIPKFDGGTGKWESASDEGGSANGKSKQFVPQTLVDDEWTMAVLRPELITFLTHKKMAEYLSAKKESSQEGGEKAETEKAAAEASDAANKEPSSEDGVAKKDAQETKEKPSPLKRKLAPEDEEHLKSLRLNVNVFLPHMRSMSGIDDSAETQLVADMERVREAASYLWDTLLPKLTQDIRDGTVNQMPADGRGLTELLHQRGINCRYLGRLATLAAAEEEKDRQEVTHVLNDSSARLSRKIMPFCWLEMLECEMIARSAKHVLDSYLTEFGGSTATQPAQTLASFLSALVSTAEETAGETETRLNKEESAASGSVPDEEDFNALTIVDTGGCGDALPTQIRDRKQVWEDIERDIGRRFRYTLSLHNRGGSTKRALYIPLLRRVCQRTGVRLAAKSYAVGGKCLCAGGTYGGRIVPSYPISPVDIVEVVPLVKHFAAQGGDGFVPSSVGSTSMLPSLYILLPDARGALEAAHIHYSARALPRALDLAQEAATLYQRVTDTPVHLSIARCVDLTSVILFDAGEAQLAAGNAGRALALAVQLGGFDSPEAAAGHTTLSHILLTSGRISEGVRHLRAALYLMEVMAGPRFADIATAYQKMGTLYHEHARLITALRCYQEASGRQFCDRLMHGMVAKSTSIVLGAIGLFKPAVENEKQAFQIFLRLFGKDHELTLGSAKALQNLTKLAVEHGNRKLDEDQKRKEEEAANAIANEIEAEVAEEERKKVKKNKKNRKGKK